MAVDDSKKIRLENPLYERVSAVARLFQLMSWQFSYLDIKHAELFTSEEAVESYRVLCDAASQGRPFMADECSILKNVLIGYLPEKRVADLRQEYTRLFIAPPILIPLAGSKWVKNKTLIAQKKGESFAVGQYYRDLGLVNQETVRDTYDQLTSELDFVSYVAYAEASAWRENDAASALEWRDLKEEFIDNHLAEFAHNVSYAIQNETDNAFMMFAAHMLIKLTELPT